MRSFFRIGITVAALAIFIHGAPVQGLSTTPIIGWLWGGSTDDSLGGGAPSIDSATGVGWVSVTSAPTNPPCNMNPADCYGVDIPNGDGAVTGYAWSSNVGWIDFQPTAAAPDGSTTGVQRSG